MTKQQIQKEWERLRFEIIENKPKIEGRYPPKIEFLRGLLIFAQVVLNRIKVKENATFNGKLYQIIMEFYNSQQRDLQRRNY